MDCNSPLPNSALRLSFQPFIGGAMRMLQARSSTHHVAQAVVCIKRARSGHIPLLVFATSSQQSLPINIPDPPSSDRRLHVSRIPPDPTSKVQDATAFPSSCLTRVSLQHAARVNALASPGSRPSRHWLTGVSFNKCNFDTPPQTRPLFIGNRLRRPGATERGFLESHHEGHWNGLATHITSAVITLQVRRA